MDPDHQSTTYVLISPVHGKPGEIFFTMVVLNNPQPHLAPMSIVPEPPDQDSRHLILAKPVGVFTARREIQLFFDPSVDPQELPVVQ